MTAIELIQRHEGLRLRLYYDTLGIVTIGYGRDLRDVGINEDEALILLQNDYTRALNEALTYPWYNSLSEPRQAVVVDMILNLGAQGFRGFQRMHAALAVGDYTAAAAAMLNSAWARRVPDRAQEDAQIMETGRWA